MEVLKTVAELHRHSDAVRGSGRRLALVPTMGCLHAGHLALVAEARRRADSVVVSIFVNPTQFAPDEDFESYPRTLGADLDACRSAGVDAVFTPPVDELYPPGAATSVEVAGLGEGLCGRSRPTHFRGVATVVAKLLCAARPDVACFGEKDYQQLALVRRLARDLCLPTEIVGVPTVREADGVALSSRNLRLAPEVRGEARALVRALDAAEALVAAGERRRDALVAAARAELAKAPSAEVDYAELVDAESLEAAPTHVAAPALLALAVRFPSREGPGAPPVRLIDNRVLRPEPGAEEPS